MGAGGGGSRRGYTGRGARAPAEAETEDWRPGAASAFALRLFP